MHRSPSFRRITGDLCLGLLSNVVLITLNVFTYLNVRKLEVAKIIYNLNIDQQFI